MLRAFLPLRRPHRRGMSRRHCPRVGARPGAGSRRRRDCFTVAPRWSGGQACAVAAHLRVAASRWSHRLRRHVGGEHSSRACRIRLVSPRSDGARRSLRGAGGSRRRTDPVQGPRVGRAHPCVSCFTLIRQVGTYAGETAPRGPRVCEAATRNYARRASARLPASRHFIGVGPGARRCCVLAGCGMRHRACT